jgi:CBS domain containing-hemolysin-like protein
MHKPEPTDPAGEPKAEPESRTTAPETGQVPESWIDRLRNIVGLRTHATFREGLADALAGDEAKDSFSPEERAMLANILRLREVRVDDVMIPRADIDAVEINVAIGDLLAAFRESGHSRMPVYRETLDDPVGMVHIKDLMGYVARAAAVTPDDGKKRRKKYPGDLDLKKVDLSQTLASANLVRNTLFVPPSMPVAMLLASMQATRTQMALVIDEYGGTDGLVSLEDVVEVVVGDIEDEHDDDGGPTIVPESDGVFVADARADLDDVAVAIGAELTTGEEEEDEDIDTLAGLVFSLLGRIPVRGELITVPGGYEIEILDADPRRIKRVRIRKRPPGAELRRRAPRRPDEPASGA